MSLTKTYEITLWEKIKKNLSVNKILYIMLIPFVAWYLVFLYKPMYGLLIAFKDYSLWKGMAGSPWSGLENFKTFMGSPYFFRSLKNTFLLSFYSLLIGFPIPIILALLLNEIRTKWFKSVIQTMTYLPHFISAVVIAGIVVNFLAPSNGLINILIDKFGAEKVYFLIKPEYFRTIYITMNIWKEAGFAAIIYIAALGGIDPQLYEAAVIDGAGKYRKLISITLPGIAPTIIIMLIMRIGKLLDVGFETVILLYNPATYETADILNTYIYRAGIQGGEYGLAAAAGFFNAIIAFILVFSANKVSQKVSETSLW
ncbi:MAG: ABC transporter permease subunit [Spirochaetaceae bacterium]